MSSNRSVAVASRMSKFSVFLLALIVITSVIVANYAKADGGQSNIPGITAKPKSYDVPENLTSMPTDEISELRDTHQDELEMALKAAESKEAVEKNMLDELMKHDLVRLSIIDVIPELIEEYNIEGEFKDDLMGYRSTFTEELLGKRENVESLNDYQAYDFRFAAVYMSMLFAFQDHSEFYERLKADMVNENSSIGSYRMMLDESYDEVEEARVQMDLVNSVTDIEHVVEALNAELARRSN